MFSLGEPSCPFVVDWLFAFGVRQKLSPRKNPSKKAVTLTIWQSPSSTRLFPCPSTFDPLLNRSFPAFRIRCLWLASSFFFRAVPGKDSPLVEQKSLARLNAASMVVKGK